MVVGMAAPDAEGSESTPPPQQQQQQPPPPSSAAGSSSPVAESFSPFQGGAPRQQRRPGIVFTEEINFCLPHDNDEEGSGSGSGDKGGVALLAGMNPEVLRIVNGFANQAAKKILIAVDCCFQVRG